MRTEDAVQSFWNASLTWRGKTEEATEKTVHDLFRQLEPLEIHRSLPLARQSQELSNMIVKMKRMRCPKPRKKLHNLVQLPTRMLQKVKAA